MGECRRGSARLAAGRSPFIGHRLAEVEISTTQPTGEPVVGFRRRGPCPIHLGHRPGCDGRSAATSSRFGKQEDRRTQLSALGCERLAVPRTPGRRSAPPEHRGRRCRREGRPDRRTRSHRRHREQARGMPTSPTRSRPSTPPRPAASAVSGEQGSRRPQAADVTRRGLQSGSVCARRSRVRGASGRSSSGRPSWRARCRWRWRAAAHTTCR